MRGFLLVVIANQIHLEVLWCESCPLISQNPLVSREGPLHLARLYWRIFEAGNYIRSHLDVRVKAIQNALNLNDCIESGVFRQNRPQFLLDPFTFCPWSTLDLSLNIADNCE